MIGANEVTFFWSSDKQANRNIELPCSTVGERYVR